MTDDQIIDQYADAFARHLVLDPVQRDQRRRELVAHLHDAALAGDLAGAIERLGPPGSAALAFGPVSARRPAPLGRRLAAAMLDHLPLLGIMAALIVQGILGAGTVTAAIPPVVRVEVGGACVALAPVDCESGAGLLSGVGVPLALLWSIVGLGLWEARSGRTPGKRLLGLAVTTESGLRIGLGAAMLRRVGLLGGPLAWADCVPVIWTGRRVLEQLTHTRVVDQR